jgi:hypothetical protein
MPPEKAPDIDNKRFIVALGLIVLGAILIGTEFSEIAGAILCLAGVGLALT